MCYSCCCSRWTTWTPTNHIHHPEKVDCMKLTYYLWFEYAYYWQPCDTYSTLSCCSTHAVSQVCVCVWVFALVCKRNEDHDYYYRMNNNSSCDFVASTCCTFWSAPLVWSRRWDALCHQRGGVWRGSVSPRTPWWEETGIALLLDHICGSTSPLAASATECTYVYDTQVRVWWMYAWIVRSIHGNS